MKPIRPFVTRAQLTIAGE